MSTQYEELKADIAELQSILDNHATRKKGNLNFLMKIDFFAQVH